MKKKNKKPAKLKPQKKKLSRNELKKMGLYSLPRKTLKYDDYIELNKLWNSYMEQQLGSDLNLLKSRLDPTNPNYDMLR